MFQVGNWVAYDFRDQYGILRTVTGVITALGHQGSDSSAVVKSDGGQPGYPRGKRFCVPVSELWFLVNQKD